MGSVSNTIMWKIEDFKVVQKILQKVGFDKRRFIDKAADCSQSALLYASIKNKDDGIFERI